MTDVGGTTLSTDAARRWQAEQAWFDVPLSQGTGGGVSALFDRPPWQRARAAGSGPGAPADPDVAAVADPFTGVKIVFNQQAAGRRRHLAVGADLGGHGGGDEPVPARPTADADSATSTRCCTQSPRAPGCRASATSRSAATPSTPRARATTWSPDSAPPTSTTWSATAHPAEGDRSEHRARPGRPGPTMECRVCQTDVPAGEFCGLCGDLLTDAARKRAGLVAASCIRRRPRRAPACGRRWPVRCSRTCRTGPARPFRFGAGRRAARAGHVRDVADARGA